MAPDSNTEIGPFPDFGVWSMKAGMRLLGEILRKSGLNCSPLLILTGLIVYGIPASSANSRTL